MGENSPLFEQFLSGPELCLNIWFQRLVWAVFLVRERRYLYHLHSKQRTRAAGVNKENILVLVKGSLLQQLEKAR